MRNFVLAISALALTACVSSQQSVQQYRQADQVRQQNILERGYNCQQGRDDGVRRGHYSAAEVREVNGYVVYDSLVQRTWCGGGSAPPPQFDHTQRRQETCIVLYEGRRFWIC
jgi:hypothetical protein